MSLNVLCGATPVFVFSLGQEVAAAASNAFSGCHSLAGIVNGLQCRPAPAGKAPKAIKRKHPLSKAKSAAKKAKAKAVAAPAAVPADAHAVEGAPAGAEAVEAAAEAGAEAVEANEPVAGAGKCVKMTRKCVTSRAYHQAKRLAKAAGLSAEQQKQAAQDASKAAGASWDQELA